MEKLNFNTEYISEMVKDMAKNSLVPYEELPQYDLFLSQVIDYLNDRFEGDKYTNNIVQNYIKSEVISKPEDGKKRGYTKQHLAQLVLLSYMRPILTADEIKKVFSLAFNEINDRNDDIISWEVAYKIFSEVQNESIEEYPNGGSLFNELKMNKIIEDSNLKPEDEERIRVFLIVMSLIAQASVIKRLVQKIVEKY